MTTQVIGAFYFLHLILETTMSSNPVTSWLSITSGSAGKLGRNGGEVGFRVLRDAAGQQLALTITSNSGGGCWSMDVLPWDAIERCLPDDRQAPVPAKAFAQAFVGKSANNGPFATAVLLALGFLARAAEHPNRYQITDRWFELKTGLLNQEAGEPYAPPTKANKDALAAMTRQDMPGEVEADDTPAGRKGHRGRPSKHAESDHDHAAPAH